MGTGCVQGADSCITVAASWAHVHALPDFEAASASCTYTDVQMVPLDTLHVTSQMVLGKVTASKPLLASRLLLILPPAQLGSLLMQQCCS